MSANEKNTKQVKRYSNRRRGEDSAVRLRRLSAARQTIQSDTTTRFEARRQDLIRVYVQILRALKKIGPRASQPQASPRQELKNQASSRKRRARFSQISQSAFIKTKNTKKQHISISSAWTKNRQHPRIALQERPEPNPVHSRGACPAVLVACITGGVLDLGARNERLGAREIFGATKTSRKKLKKSKLEQPCT